MHTRDLDQARQIGGELYYPHDLRVLGDRDRFGLEIVAVHLGPITLGWLAYDTEVEVWTPGSLETAYEINVPTGGQILTAAGKQELLASPTCGTVTRPDHDSRFRGWASPCRMLGMKIERQALETELATLIGRSAHGPIGFDMRLDLRGGRGRQWWTLVRALAEHLLRQPPDGDGPALHPLISAPLVHSLMTGLLLAARHHHRAELDALPAPARPAAVRRAVEYVEQHAHEPLTVADIAAAAGVSVRALQHTFQTSLGTTPLRHLRDVRLTRAREDLRRADPEAATVAEVAFRWGFTHLGRFADQFREKYGESPSRALRGS